MAVAEGLLALCMACHGPGGNSQVPGTPSIAGQPRIFLENQLVLIREGMREVPEMKGVLDKATDPDLVALANHFHAQKATRATGPVDDAKYRRGQAVAQKALCGTCHLPDYTGQQQVPRLAWQPEVFLLASLKQFRDRPARGRDTIMSASLYGLKDDELADLAHYLSHFKP